MLKWLRQLFCRHKWITRFRGQFTRGVVCSKCELADLKLDFNDTGEPMGWFNGKGSTGPGDPNG